MFMGKSEHINIEKLPEHSSTHFISNPRVVWRSSVQKVQRVVSSRRPSASPIKSADDSYEDFLQIKVGQVYFKKLYKNNHTMGARELEELEMPSVKSLKSIFEAANTVSHFQRKATKPIVRHFEEPQHHENTEGMSKEKNETSIEVDSAIDTSVSIPSEPTMKSDNSVETSPTESSSKLQRLRDLFERSSSVPASLGSTFASPPQVKKMDIDSSSSSTGGDIVASTPLGSPEYEPPKPTLKVEDIVMSVSKMRKRWEQMTTEKNASYSIFSSQSSPNLSKISKEPSETTIDSASSKPETMVVELAKSESATEIALLNRTKDRNSVRRLAKLFNTPLFQPKRSVKRTDSFETKPKNDQSDQDEENATNDIHADNLQPPKEEVLAIEDPQFEESVQPKVEDSKEQIKEVAQQNEEVSSARMSPPLQRQGSIKKLLQKFDVTPEYGINKLSAFFAKKFHEEKTNLLETFSRQNSDDSGSLKSIENGHMDAKTDETQSDEKELDDPVKPRSPTPTNDQAPIPQIEISETPVSSANSPLPEDDSDDQTSSESEAPRLTRHRKLHVDELAFFKESAMKKTAASGSLNGKRYRTLHPDELSLFTQQSADFFSIRARSLSEGGLKKVPKMDVIEIPSN